MLEREEVDGDVSVRRRPPRASRSFMDSPLVYFMRRDTPARPGAMEADSDSEEDLPTVRDSPEPKRPVARKPRGSGERAAERKSTRKALPKPAGLGIRPSSAGVSSRSSFGSGLAGWRAWAWVGAVLAILLCKQMASAGAMPEVLHEPSHTTAFTENWGSESCYLRLVHSDIEKPGVLVLQRRVQRLVAEMGENGAADVGAGCHRVQNARSGLIK